MGDPDGAVLPLFPAGAGPGRQLRRRRRPGPQRAGAARRAAGPAGRGGPRVPEPAPRARHGQAAATVMGGGTVRCLSVGNAVIFWIYLLGAGSAIFFGVPESRQHAFNS